MSPKKRSSILEFALLFLVVYLLSQLVMRMFFPDQFTPGNGATGLMLEARDATVKGGHHPILVIKNKTEQEFALTDTCPMPPVQMFFVEAEGTPSEKLTELTTEDTALPCEPLTVLPAGENVTLDLAPWKYSLFSSYGTYEAHIGIPDAPEGSQLTTRFSLYEPGPITQVFRTFVTKPLLNLLLFIASLLPGYSLGWAIVILTILVKLVLFVPTQHALEGQKKMQAIQPKLDALKAKYKDNPQQMQKETMRIWKEEKVNPLQSCLPMLVQFPVLIGLFYVIRDGSVLELSTHLLYGPYSDLPWTFGTQFLGLDLFKSNAFIMAPILVVAQFAQMKLSFAISNKKAEKSGKKKEQKPAQQMQQKMMMYGLPIMIGVFAFKFPAAVSLYWGVSTFFAIGQQLVVNRRTV